MKNFQTIVFSISLLILSGCGTYSQAVQVDDRAYLLLIGSPYGSVISIDNGKPINLGSETTSFNLNGKKATKIEISIGKHSIKIIKYGVVTVNRSFYVTNGNSFEVQL